MESISFHFLVSGRHWFYSSRHYLLLCLQLDELPKFAKLGMVEVLLATSVLLAVFTRWSTLVKQVLLTRSNLSDRYAFCRIRANLSDRSRCIPPIPRVDTFYLSLGSSYRFAPLWLTFIGLLSITIWLYVIQIVPGHSWTSALLTSAVTWICATSTIVAERMNIKGQLNKRNHWLISLLSLATIIHTSYLTMAAICEDNTILSVPLASTILLFSVGLWFGRKQKNLYYLATIPFATLMILLTTFISHSNLRNVNLFLFAGNYRYHRNDLDYIFYSPPKKARYGTEE